MDRQHRSRLDWRAFQLLTGTVSLYGILLIDQQWIKLHDLVGDGGHIESRPFVVRQRGFYHAITISGKRTIQEFLYLGCWLTLGIGLLVTYTDLETGRLHTIQSHISLSHQSEPG